MKIRYLLAILFVYFVYFITVVINTIGRLIDGYSIFSTDPSLSWYGSWQACALIPVLLLGIIVMLGVYLGWNVAELLDRLNRMEKKKLKVFLIKCFRLLWIARAGKDDTFSKTVRAAGKVCPKLIKK